jgi:ribosome-associated protein
MTKDILTLLNIVAQTIFDKKGMNILGIDIQGISSITDFIIIAEGTVDRHVIAIAKTIIDRLKEKGLKPLYSEGLQVGDWLVLDYGQFMVHLFMPGLRDKYRLEELWRQGKIIPLKIDLNPSQAASTEFFK